MLFSNNHQEKIIEELTKQRKLSLNVQSAQNLKLDDIYALNLLQPLLTESYLPFTASSMRPISLVHILNNIVINNCKVILEFGSGLSSIVIGRLIKKNSIDAEILSVDHNLEWIGQIDKILEKEDLKKIVKPIHAPLTGNNFHDVQWYDAEILERQLSGKEFDLVIIDGPPAWHPDKKLSRFPAFPYAIKKLSQNATVYLDDAHRNGEQQVISKWEREFNVKFELVHHTLAQLKMGEGFDNTLFGY